jgi:D-beta-D-heptose 7-phosphate kinase/D-beta-D-heptose 1-phosphate adenosyltransferase
MSPELVGQATDFLKQTHSKAARVAVVGDLALDRFVFGNVERISPEAPVPVLHVERSTDKPGCAANVAWNMSSLMESMTGLSLSVLGVVGNDAPGSELKGFFSELGPRVDLKTLVDSSRPTTLKMRYLAGAQHQLLRVDIEDPRPIAEAVQAELQREYLKLLKSCRFVVLQDYAKGLFARDLLRDCLKSAREAGVFTLVDPHRTVPVEFYQGACLLKPNVAEAEALLGRDLSKGESDKEIAQACLDLKKQLDLKMAMITRGRFGITVLDETDQVHHLPALSRAVYDVTGAGDTVVATLAVSLAMGASLQVACALAVAAASVVVGKVGTATASPAEILAELERLA